MIVCSGCLFQYSRAALDFRYRANISSNFTSNDARLTDVTVRDKDTVNHFTDFTAKFSPFFSRAISASLRDLEDKLITQLVLSTYGVSTGDIAACFSCISFSNFCFCLSLVVLKTVSNNSRNRTPHGGAVFLFVN